jgi:hypothetical protein
MTEGQNLDAFNPRLQIASWLLASILGLGFAFLTLTPDNIYHSYFLVGIDSFYHAARILNGVAGGTFYEWDPRGFYPDGAWIAWPWAYDWALIALSKLFLALGGSDPITLLVQIPPLWLCVNLAIVASISRRLKLHAATTAFVLICFAILPIHQQLHLAGRIDHHFIELTAVLCMIYFLLRVAEHPDDQISALLLGVALGLAHGINNSLFLLQVPVLITLGILWLTQHKMPMKSAIALAAALLLTTVILVLPSEPFQKGLFSYYVLSGFHIYVAACTGIVVLFLAWRAFSIRYLAIIVVASILLGLPLFQSVATGLEYVNAASFSPLESESVFQMNLPSLLYLYTPLLPLAPIATIALFFLTRREPLYLALAITSMLGLFFLLSQVRFALYGSFALLYPLAVITDRMARPRFHPKLTNAALLSGLIGLLFLSVTATKFMQIRDWNPEYFENLKIFHALGQQCAKDPGLALVDPNQGHYVLYHSACQVIANNATLTQRHLDARKKTQEYLALTPEQLLEQLPEVKYIVVTRYDGTKPVERPRAKQRNNSGLHARLLTSDLVLPDQFQLIGRVMTLRDGETIPLSSLFKISEPAP